MIDEGAPSPGSFVRSDVCRRRVNTPLLSEPTSFNKVLTGTAEILRCAQDDNRGSTANSQSAIDHRQSAISCFPGHDLIWCCRSR